MHSTELALWIFVSILWEGLDHHQKTMVIALDIESPYDRPWCMGMLTKLTYHQVAFKRIGQTQSPLSDHKIFYGWVRIPSTAGYGWVLHKLTLSHLLSLVFIGVSLIIDSGIGFCI